MAMTSLNISLPENLKAYVEGQVSSGDWGTPSEYIRELIRQDKERRMANLEQELLAAAKGAKDRAFDLRDPQERSSHSATRTGSARVRAHRIVFSDAEQSDWYAEKAGRSLAKRWEAGVTSTLLQIPSDRESAHPASSAQKSLAARIAYPSPDFPNI